MELRLEFLAPLIDEEGRDEDDGPAGRVVKQELAEDDPGLDGLSQAHLVGEEVSLDRVLEDAPCDLHLVGIEFDSGGKESGHPPACGTLRDERPHESEASVVKKRGLLGLVDERLRRVSDRDLAPDEDRLLGEESRRCALAEDDLVFALEEAVDSPHLPPAFAVADVATGLGGDPRDALDARGRDDLVIAAGDRMEVFDGCPVALDGSDLPDPEAPEASWDPDEAPVVEALIGHRSLSTSARAISAEFLTA